MTSSAAVGILLLRGESDEELQRIAAFGLIGGFFPSLSEWSLSRLIDHIEHEELEVRRPPFDMMPLTVLLMQSGAATTIVAAAIMGLN